MDNAILAQCGTWLGGTMPMILAAFIAGLVGSATHCAVMCSAMVTVQMLDVQRLGYSMGRMGYYHLGRISVYVLCAVLVQQAGSWFFAGHIEPYRCALLLVAGGMFLFSAIAPKMTHHVHRRCCSSSKHHDAWGMLRRGMVMGMMPCGMVFSMLMMVGAVSSAAYAALIMAMYGIATVPLVHVIGLGSVRMLGSLPHVRAWASRIGLGINGMILIMMSMGI
ncbi:MAG: sulfite exporter TauE/SafE family protein [Alphaproteobacteria bacterium]|nr:MAG: sulfite exporter TauE/SafE family protein [Alphaproteobacteria bacterium]TAF14460.1 MAG: sulfite exporter TauE/SafE family protein [Alphaproteobacteria bacterium]TAF38759.1 MAG: sulfite exporter TauE/SafE family protein [Alphaproteobacteria bacterium]TAF77613.1 MAG: sulfite exporter TauE/SafE family protein [Alphaproteobacteria bacterium]